MAPSSDEGEIVEDSAHNMKASSLPRAEGSGVDRQDRHKGRHSTPDNDTASRRSNSSRRSRSPRGLKRAHDERDHYGSRGAGRDDWQTRPRHDEPPSTRYQRGRAKYDDTDRYTSRHSNFDDGRRYRDREGDRQRGGHRGRYDDVRSGDRFVREGHFSRREDASRDHLQYDDDRRPHDNYGPSSRRNPTAEPLPSASHGRDTHRADAHSSVPAASEPRPEPEPEDDFEEPEPIDEEAEIQRRRKRREEILSKSSSATPLLLHAVGVAADKARASSPASAQSGTPLRVQSDAETPRTPRSDFASPQSPASQDAPSPGGIDLMDDKNLMNRHGEAKLDDEDGPSAADYDPTVDMQEDERRDELRHGQVVVHGEPHAVETIEEPIVDESKSEQRDKPAADGDEDDDFDMFADDFDEEKYEKKPAKTAATIGVTDSSALAAANGKVGILDGDDKDGYYKIRVGEVLDGRYQLQATLGRGMFSSVVRALDVSTKKSVAIKIMRNNDALRKGGYTEIAILEKLNDADPEQKKHIIAFERAFDYRGHLCMAFESLSLNLREVLRKFGNNVGINLGATRTYAYQSLVALAHMRKCSIIHADLKPDNILVNEGRNVLKICDLGTAIDRSDAATANTEITPYLVSRFYRAPEIILGMPYDYGVDMWSIGCTLYELYTGKILFTGDSNNQMLKSIMEIRGRLTPKLFKRGQLSAVHFDEQGQFVSIERDKVLGKTAVRTLPMMKPTRDLRTRLLAASSGMNDTESRDLNNFVDLLEHCLALNPDKRIKPSEALRHPFFTARMPMHNKR